MQDDVLHSLDIFISGLARNLHFRTYLLFPPPTSYTPGTFGTLLVSPAAFERRVRGMHTHSYCEAHAPRLDLMSLRAGASVAATRQNRITSCCAILGQPQLPCFLNLFLVSVFFCP